jgi:hypothetical protein
LTGGGTTGAVTLNLGNTAVAAGSYTAPTLSIDAQGRITSASSNSYLPLSGGTLTGNTSITASAGATFLISGTGGATDIVARTQFRSASAEYAVGTSNNYLGNLFYITSTAIAGQAGSQLGFGMFPNGDTHMANTNGNVSSGPLVRMGPAVTLNSSGLARLNVESRDVGGTGFICEWYNNSPTAVGSITLNGGGVLYNTSSDYRLKENVAPVERATERLKQLDPVQYNYIGHLETIEGFIAHEVQEVVPSAVVGTKDGVSEDGKPVYQGLDASKIIPLLTAALQEAVSRIETLEAELAALKAN